MPKLRRAATCQEAVHKGLGWLQARMQPDGAFGQDASDLQSCHKVPLLLNSTGHVEECRRCLDWLEEHLRLPDGSFRAPGDGARVNCTAWVAMGAQVSARFDLSLPAIRFLAASQGRHTGGVYEHEGHRRTETYDLQTTAAAGLAFLFCGAVAEARLAGRCLGRALALQKDCKTFYIRFNVRGQPAIPSGKVTQPYAVAIGEPGQWYSALGMPAGFLVTLYRATGEEDFLDAAEGYLEIAHSCAPTAGEEVMAAPLAWAAAAYYHVTRSRRHLELAEKIVGFLLDHQREDGSWLPDGQASPEKVAPPVAINTVATTTLVLNECLREVQ